MKIEITPGSSFWKKLDDQIVKTRNELAEVRLKFDDWTTDYRRDEIKAKTKDLTDRLALYEGVKAADENAELVPNTFQTTTKITLTDEDILGAWRFLSMKKVAK